MLTLYQAYDMLKGPHKDLVTDSTLVDKILAQCRHLVDNLSVAFGGASTGIPDNTLQFGPPRRAGSRTNGPATVGTLILEWQRLSDLVGNQTYASLVQKGQAFLMNPKPESRSPWPGLVGNSLSIQTGLFENADGGWVGGIDSYYEYLIKVCLVSCVVLGGWVEGPGAPILTEDPPNRCSSTTLVGTRTTKMYGSRQPTLLLPT